MTETLSKTMRNLRLSGALESLDVRLQEAAGNGLKRPMTVYQTVAPLKRDEGRRRGG